MEQQSWRVLVVDDEPPIRAELRYLLRQDARIGSIEEAGSGSEAVEKILENKPDVLFLDIQMPGTSGIKLADTLHGLKRPPVLVFVTAFSEYAAEAFDLDAVDYVLKPVEQERLAKALDRVASAMAHRRQTSPTEPVSRVAVECNGKRSYIPVANVAYFEARADYTTAFTANDSYLVCDSISTLERRLASQGFLRVHRSYLVNIDDIRDVEIMRPSGLMQLKLDRTGASIPVSRRRATGVKHQLGLS